MIVLLPSICRVILRSKRYSLTYPYIAAAAAEQSVQTFVAMLMSFPYPPPAGSARGSMVENTHT